MRARRMIMVAMRARFLFRCDTDSKDQPGQLNCQDAAGAAISRADLVSTRVSARMKELKEKSQQPNFLFKAFHWPLALGGVEENVNALVCWAMFHGQEGGSAVCQEAKNRRNVPLEEKFH